VNLLKNGIGVEQARALVIILKDHSTLKSLCGKNGDETELDMSGKMEGAEDAIMLAAEIVDNWALFSLDMSNNNIGQLVMGEGWQYDKDAKEYWKNVDSKEIVEKQLPEGEELATARPAGAIALVDAIKNMRALTSLNLSSNNLQAEGASIVAEAMKVPILLRSCWHHFHVHLTAG
jgi:hypothetical protein